MAEVSRPKPNANLIREWLDPDCDGLTSGVKVPLLRVVSQFEMSRNS